MLARVGEQTGQAAYTVIKLHPRLRQVINIWGFMKSGTISAKIHHPHIIDQEEDKICLLLSNEESEASRDKIKNLLIKIVELKFLGDAQSDYTRESPLLQGSLERLSTNEV